MLVAPTFAAMPELETVTLEAVEILSVGGPVHGVGSPPEGDYWTTDDLRAMADAAQELEAAGEWRIPARVKGEPLGLNKVGHDKDQTLLSAEPTAGEMPAAGWITNQRVSDDGKKLLADITDVPKKLGALIKAKAYRTRSSELSKVTSQTTGKTYDWVVSGLAWLGGKMPAVRTLDDVVAMYESEGLNEPDARVIVVYAEGDGEVIWAPEAGFQDLLSDINAALNPGPGTSRYWATDVSVDRTRAIVQDYTGGQCWIVPITVGADGEPTLSPTGDWTEAEQAWVKAARDFMAAVTVRNRRADIRRDVPEKTYTDEQRRKFAEAIPGDTLKADDVTDEMLANAGVPLEETEPKKDLEADERFRSLEQTAKDADERSRKLETELHDERRRNFVEGLVKDCKIEPGDTEKWEKRFDADPVQAREYAADLKPDEDLLRELGSDEETLDDDALEAQNKSYEDDAETRLGIPKEAIL